MNGSRPPRFATLLLERLGPQDDSILGDLAEESRAGRSALWYWRQVLAAMVIASSRSIRAHKILSVRWLVIGVAVYYIVGIPSAELRNETSRLLTPLVATWVLDYRLYEIWDLVLVCASFSLIGWLIAGLNPRHEMPAIVIFVAFLTLFEFPRFAWTALHHYSASDFAWYLLMDLVRLTVCITGTMAGAVRLGPMRGNEERSRSDWNANGEL